VEQRAQPEVQRVVWLEQREPLVVSWAASVQAQEE
jgi:hypothetical protein